MSPLFRYNNILGITILVLIACVSQVSAQSIVNKNSISLSQELSDYNVQLLDDKIFVFDSATSNFVRLGYEYRLHPSWTLTAGLSNGFITNYLLEEEVYSRLFATSADAALLLRTDNGKIFKTDSRLSPFFSFGYRADLLSGIKGDSRVLIPHSQYGAGMHLRISPGTRFQLQMVIDQKLFDNFNTHLRYRFGLVQELSKKNKNFENEVLAVKLDSVRIDSQQYDIASRPLSDSLNILSQDSLILKDLSEKNYIDSVVVIEENVESEKDKISSKEVIDTLIDSKNNNQVEIVDEKGVSEKDSVLLIDSSNTIDSEKDYYVICFSFLDLNAAKKYKRDLAVNYDGVKLLKQPSGLNRVGIYAGRDKAEALKILQEVKIMHPKAWLTTQE